MRLRVPFLALLVICGLSFNFMDFESASKLENSVMPFLFCVTFVICFFGLIAWIIWQTQRWGGRPAYRSNYPDAGGYSSGGFDSGWGSDSTGGFGDSGGCDGGGGGDCGGGGD